MLKWFYPNFLIHLIRQKSLSFENQIDILPDETFQFLSVDILFFFVICLRSRHFGMVSFGFDVCFMTRFHRTRGTGPLVSWVDYSN